MEWWKADNVTGYAPHAATLPANGSFSYFAATFGANVRPHANIVISAYGSKYWHHDEKRYRAVLKKQKGNQRRWFQLFALELDQPIALLAVQVVMLRIPIVMLIDCPAL